MTGVYRRLYYTVTCMTHTQRWNRVGGRYFSNIWMQIHTCLLFSQLFIYVYLSVWMDSRAVLANWIGTFLKGTLQLACYVPKYTFLFPLTPHLEINKCYDIKLKIFLRIYLRMYRFELYTFFYQDVELVGVILLIMYIIYIGKNTKNFNGDWNNLQNPPCTTSYGPDMMQTAIFSTTSFLL